SRAAPAPPGASSPPGHPPAPLTPRLDALLHAPPDPQQAGPDRRLAPAGLLVGQHHAADRQARPLGPSEQFRAGAEGVRHRRGVLLDPGRTLLVLAEHEAAADRVVGAF